MPDYSTLPLTGAYFEFPLHANVRYTFPKSSFIESNATPPLISSIRISFSWLHFCMSTYQSYLHPNPNLDFNIR